ncbi:MAG TPA: exodeoxyribonuclease VII small subunit [Ignavibacteriaceae bacterium]|nr:exodeoxyribonuclease VII small subunit [Ignavibacteriaceae bacterium]
MPKKSKAETFEDKLQRLEKISIQLEDDEIGIEKAIELYEEGIKLSKDCTNTLKKAELKITELKSKLSDLTEDEIIEE